MFLPVSSHRSPRLNGYRSGRFSAELVSGFVFFETLCIGHRWAASIAPDDYAVPGQQAGGGASYSSAELFGGGRTIYDRGEGRSPSTSTALTADRSFALPGLTALTFGSSAKFSVPIMIKTEMTPHALYGLKDRPRRLIWVNPRTASSVPCVSVRMAAPFASAIFFPPFLESDVQSRIFRYLQLPDRELLLRNRIELCSPGSRTSWRVHAQTALLRWRSP